MINRSIIFDFCRFPTYLLARFSQMVEISINPPLGCPMRARNLLDRRQHHGPFRFLYMPLKRIMERFLGAR